MIGKLAASGALLIAAALWVVLAWPAAEPQSAESPPLAEPPALAPPPSAAEPAALAAPATTAAPPAAGPTAEATAEPAPEPVAASDDPIAREQGPVDEYRKRFESEPRDSIAPEYEKHISGAFAVSSGHPDLFKSVLCRETICRIELRWSKDRQRSYMQSVTRLGIGGRHGHVPEGKYSFSMPLALSPVGQPDADGTRLVELYVKRNPPNTRAAPLPAHEH